MSSFPALRARAKGERDEAVRRAEETYAARLTAITWLEGQAGAVSIPAGNTAAADDGSVSRAAAIRAVVTTQEGVFTIPELLRHHSLKGFERTNVASTVNRLLKAGVIERKGRGKYRVIGESKP